MASSTSPVHEGVLRGTLFVPPGAGRHPAVLVVGGSDGGVPLRRAAWLASHGYIAFALAYFRFEDLPPQLENIPLEYFQYALQWMVKRPEIGDSRIAVLGTSRGGELALQLGSMFPRIGAVVAYVPANVRIASCCREYRRSCVDLAGARAALCDSPADENPRRAASATIEVENTKGPILMISGEGDRSGIPGRWPTTWSLRLKSHHFAYSFENLKYPARRPLRRPPGIRPHVAWRRSAIPHRAGRTIWAATAEGDAKSSIDSIPKVLEFLRKNLAGQQ